MQKGASCGGGEPTVHSALPDVRAFRGSLLLRLSSSMAIRQHCLTAPVNSGGAEDAAESPLHCYYSALSGQQHAHECS